MEATEKLCLTASSAAMVAPLLTTLSTARQIAVNRVVRSIGGCSCNDSHAWLKTHLALLRNGTRRNSPAAASPTAAAAAAAAGRKDPGRSETPRQSDASSLSSADTAAAAPFAGDAAAGVSEHPLWLSFLGPDSRAEWARAQIRARAPEYTARRPLSVRVCTWNVNAKPPPPPADLRGWLLAAEEATAAAAGGAGGGGRPDLIAVGLQETIALTAAALMVTAAPPPSLPHSR